MQTQPERHPLADDPRLTPEAREQYLPPEERRQLETARAWETERQRLEAEFVRAGGSAEAFASRWPVLQADLILERARAAEAAFSADSRRWLRSNF
jgi:hypothetical protein